MDPTQKNRGFDGRMFLAEQEWLTYLRRKPVRYVRRLVAGPCSVCQRAPERGNPLQHAHVIGFELGIVSLALTPDFLDSSANLVPAHRRGCNKKAEVNLERAIEILKEIGVDALPPFLPEAVRREW